MSLSRRAFIVSAALTGVSTGLAGGDLATRVLAFQKPDGPALPPAAYLTKADFTDLVGTPFRIRYGERGWINLWLDTVLTKVEDLFMSDAQKANGGECFRIVLRSAAEVGLVQGTYLIDSPKLGSMALMLSPKGQDDTGGGVYEAVFNHVGTGRSLKPRRR